MLPPSDPLHPPPAPSDDARDGIFATTQWNVVLEAGADTDQGRAALESLCEQYWFPVYALVRRRGLSPEAARDCTQEFFAHLLEKDGLARVRRERGRFRSFLAQSVRNFLADAWDRTQAQKRGGGATHLSIEAEAAEGRYLEGSDDASPDHLFDRAWAEQLLATSRARLSRELEDGGNGPVLEILERLGDPAAPSLAVEAERLHLPLNTLKSHLHRARRRQIEILRELIGETVSTSVEIDGEIQHLLAALL
jgi:DNA-directed RNA polymerase specialized sigma24 family protein